MKWNGRYYRPGYGIPVYPKKESSIEDLLKPLGEKVDKGNVWRPILNQPINVFKGTPVPPISPTPTPTITVSPTPTLTITPTPSITPTISVTPTITPTPSAVAFDSSYQSILNYATSQGFTLPSSSGQTLQNQLVVDLKAAGIWTDLDIFYVFATDGDENFAKINWKNPGTYTALENGTVNFTSKVGFQNSTANVANYLSTQFNPNTNKTAYTQNSAVRFVWDYDNSSGGDNIYDGMLGTAENTLRGDTSSEQRINSGTSNITTAFNNSGSGLKVIERTSSTNLNMYNNSATPTSYTVTSAAIYSSTQILLRRGSAGTSLRKISMYGLGAGLTTKVTDLLSDTTTYMTGL